MCNKLHRCHVRWSAWSRSQVHISTNESSWGRGTRGILGSRNQARPRPSQYHLDQSGQHRYTVGCLVDWLELDQYWLLDTRSFVCCSSAAHCLLRAIFRWLQHRTRLYRGCLMDTRSHHRTKCRRLQLLLRSLPIHRILAYHWQRHSTYERPKDSN